MVPIDCSLSFAHAGEEGTSGFSAFNRLNVYTPKPLLNYQINVFSVPACFPPS